jgi:hypothetical protein
MSLVWSMIPDSFCFLRLAVCSCCCALCFLCFLLRSLISFSHMFFASAVLLLSSYVAPAVASTTVEQMGISYGQTLDEMTVTFASFSALDESAQCSYGTDANDLRYYFVLCAFLFVLYVHFLQSS